MEPDAAATQWSAALRKSGTFDRLIKATAIRLSRRRFAGNVLAATAAAWAVQLLGFPTPPVYAFDCTNCNCCTGVCSCLYAPASCCSPNGVYCYSGDCTCQGRDCQCGCFAMFFNVCNDGSHATSCPACNYPCPTCNPC
jgi:hypothetical protein